MKPKPNEYYEERFIESNMLIAGIPGSGKSYYFETEILPEILNDGRQIIILDYKNQYKTPAHVSLSSLKGPATLGEIMQGVYSKGRKPHVLRIISQNYDVDRIDSIIFNYLCNSTPKIFIMEEAHFYFEDLVKKQIPEYTKKYFRTCIGRHNKDQGCVMITQFTRDIPGKILNTFQDGRLFYLPLKELYYLHEIRYLEEDPDTVHSIISPFKSYKYYDVGAYLHGERQPFDEIDDEVEISDESLNALAPSKNNLKNDANENSEEK
jgi:hypothetical protein